MPDDFIEYWLPMTSLTVKGTVTTRTDSILDEKPAPKSASKVTRTELTLETVADHTRADPYVAKTHHGWLLDTSVTIELTDNRRLVSASSESSGEAGKVLLGVVGVAATGVSIAASFGPGVLLAGGSLAAAGRAYKSFRVEDQIKLADELAEDALAAPTDEQKVAMAFLEQQKDVALARKHFSNLAVALLDDLKDALEAVEKAEEDDEGYKNAMARVTSCQKALAVARSEAARLDAVFAAWRASTIVETSENAEYSIPIKDVITAGTSKDGQLRPPTQGDLKEVLHRLGVWLVVEQDEKDRWTATEDLPPGVREGVVLREPRQVVFAIKQYYKDDQPAPYPEGPADIKGFRLVEQRHCFIVDSDCRSEFIAFRRSWFGKRTVAVTLSPLGGLKTYAATTTSQAAALAEAATAVPSTVGGALEDAAKVRGGLDALGDRSVDVRIAELKKQIDLKNQELLLTGLSATEAKFAELERLKQEQAVLEAQEAIRKSQAGVHP